jgi:hypothetical protein
VSFFFLTTCSYAWGDWGKTACHLESGPLMTPVSRHLTATSHWLGNIDNEDLINAGPSTGYSNLQVFQDFQPNLDAGVWEDLDTSIEASLGDEFPQNFLVPRYDGNAIRQQAVNDLSICSPFSGYAPVGYQAGLQPSAQTLPSANLEWNYTNFGTGMHAAALPQPSPALGIETRRPQGRRSSVNEASQRKDSRIACNKPGCVATFGRPAEFRRHLDTKHNRRQNQGFRCVVCKYEYPRMDKVRSHMEKMHGLRLEKITEAE